MNILTEKLPDYIDVAGERYFVNTDFRVWIKFDILMSDRRKSFEEKVVSAIKLCINSEKSPKLPPDFTALMNGLLNFYSGDVSQPAEKSAKRIYSFCDDAESIYAAFMSQYGIDLTDSKMHWRQFSALFKCLGDDTVFMRTVAYRSMDTSKITDAKKRAFYNKMKKIHALGDNRTEKERDNDTADTLFSIF